MIAYQSITSPPCGSVEYPLDNLNPWSIDVQQLLNLSLRSLIPKKKNINFDVNLFAILTFDILMTTTTHTTIATTTSTLNRTTGTTMDTTSIREKS